MAKKKRATPQAVQREAMAAFKKLSDDRAWAALQANPTVDLPRIPAVGNTGELDVDLSDNVLMAAPWTDSPQEPQPAPQQEQKPTETERKTQAEKAPTANETEIPEASIDVYSTSIQPMPESTVDLQAKPVFVNPMVPDQKPTKGVRQAQAVSEGKPSKQSRTKQASGSAKPTSTTRTAQAKTPQGSSAKRAKTPVPFINDMMDQSPNMTLDQVEWNMQQIMANQMQAISGEETSESISVFSEQTVSILERITQHLAVLTVRLRLVENVLDRIGG